jgi:hypothetical protein
MRRPRSRKKVEVTDETVIVEPVIKDTAIVVGSNLLDGHSEEEYLLTAHGARAGLVDKGVITAPAGALFREWIYLLQHLYIVCADCQSQGSLMYDSDAMKLDGDQILGSRYDKEGNIISVLAHNQEFRSPIFCKATDQQGHVGICQKCYGNNPATGELPTLDLLPVGILAAQALGERISQESMKSFHTGGTDLETEDSMGVNLIETMKTHMKMLSLSGDPLPVLQSMWQDFPQANKPRMVHFEILIRGMMDNKVVKKGLLSSMARPQGGRPIFGLARNKVDDDLHSVIGRIISGKFINNEL